MKVKNEVTVGIMVVGGIVLAVIGAFWLSGKPWGEEQVELTAIFREVGEIRQGNPVKYRGVQIGRVTEIALAPGGNGVLVSLHVSPTIELPPRPGVVLAPASLFGDWQGQIVSITQYPELEFTSAGVPGILPGTALPDISQLTAVAARIASDIETLANRVEVAFTEETAVKIRETIENVQEISEQLTGFVDQQTAAYAAVANNLEAATATVERVAGGVETQVPEILASARTAAENLEELSQQLEAATVGIPGLVARADTTLGTIGRVAEDVGGVVQGLEPQLQEIGPTLIQAQQALATLERAAARIEEGEGTLGRLLEDPALYEETQAAIATLRRILADLQANPEKYIGAIKIFE
ncbi:MAG TPA: MlaD family protein [Longimicrobiaceae bacterium]|nr:MlaD family protein [Longimicrobiaceae bacterium]